MHKKPNSNGRQDEDRQLRGNNTEDIALAQKQEGSWKAGEIVNAACDGLGQPAKQRKRAQGDNQGWQFQPSN